MSVVKSPEATRSTKPAELERNISAVRQQSSPAFPMEDTGEKASTLVLRVSAESTREIDRLIDGLKNLREKLRNDSSRLQRDIVEYASLSQSAIQLTKIVTDSLTHVKGMSDTQGVNTKLLGSIVPTPRSES